MKPLLLLLLLTSWAHLGSEARSCNTDVSITKHLITVDESRAAGAEAYFIKSYIASNVKTCLEDCCLQTYGNCTVAAYRNRNTDWTCLHFYCQPLASCKFFSTDIADSYLVTQSLSPHIQLIKNVATPVINVVNSLRDHERSVTARKGVDNIPIERKGIHSHKVHNLDNELIDNITTSKSITEITLNDTISNTSVIQPPDGADQKSKIKPRKGVSPLLSTNIQSNPVESIKYNTVLNNSNDVLSFLSDVFTDDTNNTEQHAKHSRSDLNKLIHLEDIVISPSKTSYFQHSSSGDIQPDSTFDIQSKSAVVQLNSVDIQPNSVDIQTNSVDVQPKSAVVQLNSVDIQPNSVDVQPKSAVGIQPSSVESIFISSTVLQPTFQWTEHNGTEDSMINLYSSISSEPSTILLSSISTDSTAEFLSTNSLLKTKSLKSSGEISPTKSRLQSLELETATVNTTQENKPSNQSIILNAIKKIDDGKVNSENERKYKSSMHLVFALVFGLLVLFAVFGTIAKKIYDGWVRRHYHRMDFLIDGMYDGYT